MTYEELASRDLQDFQAICAEIAEFASRSVLDQWEAIKKDWVGTALMEGIRLPECEVYLTAKARVCFEQVLHRRMRCLGTRAQVHRKAVVLAALKRRFLKRILEGRELEQHDTDNIFAAALSELEDSYEERTFYLPCSGMTGGPTAFSLGPVSFELTSSFFERRYLEIVAQCKSTDTIQRVRDHFLTYRWIASVKSPRCDEEIARAHAHDCIQKALDLLKLAVGSEFGGRMRTAANIALPAGSAELSVNDKGNFGWIFAPWVPHDAMAADDWLDQFKSQPLWTSIEGLIWKYHQTLGRLGEIEIRFLDALGWHSDALSEPSLPARIVKFWTAIERLLSTSHGGKKTATRAAVLATMQKADFQRRENEANGLYKHRCDIIHGTANRHSETWFLKTSSRSEVISRNALVQYAFEIPQILSRSQDTERKRLMEWLGDLDRQASFLRKDAKTRQPDQTDEVV